MHVEQLQLMREHDLVHPHGEREIVGRVLEERVASDVDFVEVDPRAELPEPERLLVGDEVHLVAARGERDAEFGRERARTAVGGIAGNADLHEDSWNHASACARA